MAARARTSTAPIAAGLVEACEDQRLLLDEAAHMLDTDGNQAAEPVFRSLVPSVSQFGDDARVIVASTPFGLDGFFAEVYGQAERGALPGAHAAHATTLEARPGFA